MKRVAGLLIVVLLATNLAMAQSSWKLGANVGLPVGEMDDVTDLQWGADLTYMYELANIVGIGAMAGYSQYVTDDRFIDVLFLPVAASGRIGFPRGLFIGADLGYAFGLSDNNDGGIYYRPKLGFNLFGLSLIASYSGVNAEGASFNSVNLGVEFGL